MAADATFADYIRALDDHTKALNSFINATAKTAGASAETTTRTRAADKDDKPARTSGRPARGSEKDDKGSKVNLATIKERFTAFLQDASEDEVDARTDWVKELAYDLSKVERISEIDSSKYEDAIFELDKEEKRISNRGDDAPRGRGRGAAV